MSFHRCRCLLSLLDLPLLVGNNRLVGWNRSVAEMAGRVVKACGGEVGEFRWGVNGPFLHVSDGAMPYKIRLRVA